MPRYGLATLNHSPLFGLPTQWEAHLDAAAEAGFDALAPDIFWLRALEAEGVSLETVAAGLRDRGLACMETAGIAIGDAELTARELEENLRYAHALDAEFVNARIVEPVDAGLVERVRDCARAFQERGAAGGTRIALEFSRGTKIRGVADTEALAEAVAEAGIGVTIDTWHFFLHPDGPDWAALEALAPERLANVQLSDGVPYDDDFGEATMNARRQPGDGDFELARCAGVLAQKGFGDDGAVVVEVLSAEERSRPLAEFAQRAMAASRKAWEAAGAS